MEEEEREEIEAAELADQGAELVPEREEMPVIDLGEGGGLAPPAE